MGQDGRALSVGAGARDENESHGGGDFELSMPFRPCHVRQVTDLSSGESGDGLLSCALGPFTSDPVSQSFLV